MKAISRPVNLYDSLMHWLRYWKPDCSFTGRTRSDFERWQRQFRRHYRQCLGGWPERVPLKPTVVSREEKPDHFREKILYDSSFGVTVPAWLLIPKNARRRAHAGLLAAHGHGNGKDDIVGVTREAGNPADIQRLDRLNYEYALDAVRRGYVVIAPDWCPFGERRPPEDWIRPGRDACNVVDLSWLYFGRPLITQNIWDGMRAVDILSRHPAVDPQRLGVIGLSQGGTMATHLIVNDRRLRCAVVSGYISTVRGDALTRRGEANTCGAQHVPRLLLHGDIPDMLGLAAPKPVLCEMGRMETCFHFPDMIRAYRHLERIYRAAGAADCLAADIHPNDHRWSGVKAWDWLERNLGPAAARTVSART